ncbi:hypothetical protein [Mycoplana ramosa]|uniref:Uncharacterized protein n=1 Tax=Mycoplana ramosa TaxID=40837 RepID=A0ABW3Z1K3_MYCRA
MLELTGPDHASVLVGRAQEVFTPDCLRFTYDINIERMQLPDGTPIVVPV